jgi:FHA domain
VTAPVLFLVHASEAVPLGTRAIAIGRLPECDVMLDGWEVSRRHARIVPTSAGPVLVDRSRYGTFVNNLQVVAPLLLTDGDLLRVGPNELRISRTPAPGVIRRARTSPQSRLARWWKRYGLSESGGAVAALAGALPALYLGSGIPLAAIAGTAVETGWSYLLLAVRDLRYEARAHRAAGRAFNLRAAGDVLRNLVNECGRADAIDLLVRPVCLGLGLSLLQPAAGVLAGKVAADLIFYGPVLAMWHWRRTPRTPPAAELNRLRPTAATAMPVGELADLHARAEAEAVERPVTPPRLSTER